MLKMKDLQIIASDLFLIEHSFRFQMFVGVPVVLGKNEIGLVDTGFVNTPVDYIFPFLQELRRSPKEISYVVNTHPDSDHIGGNKAIKEITGAKIAIHELDSLESEFVDIMLKDGDFVKLGDRKFSIIHTPGHTPGSICLYDKKKSLLLSGDSILGERLDIIRMDPEIYIDSLNKLLDLKIEILVMPHPFKPAGKAILIGEESKEMIRKSISLARAGSSEKT